MKWKPSTPEEVKALEEIQNNVFYSAVFEFESGNNPLATNKSSSAKGAFQLIDATAKKLGVKDVFDLADNFEGFKKLTEEHKQMFGEDYQNLYAAHYLGATIFRKVRENKVLNTWQAKIYQYYLKQVKPKFERTLEKHRLRIYGS